MTVLQFTRRLDHPPVLEMPADWRLRHYESDADVERFLTVRAAAFADSAKLVRTWTRADFAREIQSKSWWRPEAMWFVERIDCSPPLTIGTGILARRGPADSAVPVIHWLGVLPEYRRQGVGRLLVAQLEALAWQAGHGQIALETHASWTAAVAFYRALGYRATSGL